MEAITWNKIVATFPKPHILQTWQWGMFKARYGWDVNFKVWGNDEHPDAATLILQRRLPARGFPAHVRILYLPKGPLLRNINDKSLVDRVFDDLRDYARIKGAIFIKIDPDIPLGWGIPGKKGEKADRYGMVLLQTMLDKGWQFSTDQVQFRNTVLVDLSPSEDEILARMKQKTRYNIRLSGRRGVKVRTASTSDLDLLYRMYAETSQRDGFVIRNANYYRDLWESFMVQMTDHPDQKTMPVCEPLIAEIGGEPVAAVVIFSFGGIAYYMHGMSRLFHREKMPNYLLQWEAIRQAKAAGCKIYDLWGAPEVFNDSDPLWGVYRFKEGLGGEVRRTIGAYDLPIKRNLYRIYTQVLPRILGIMRRHRMKTMTME